MGVWRNHPNESRSSSISATPMQLINKRVFLVFSAKNVIVLLAVAQVLSCSICLAVKHLIQLQCQWIKGKKERFLAHSHQRLATDHNMDQSVEEICTEHLSLYCPYKLNWSKIQATHHIKLLKQKSVHSLVYFLCSWQSRKNSSVYLNEERLKSQTFIFYFYRCQFLPHEEKKSCFCKS